MQIAAPNANLREILGQILGHALRQCGHQNAFVFPGADANFFQQIVHLALDGTNFDLWVHQAGRADHLFDDYATGLGKFVRTGRRGDIDDLIDAVLEFFKGQWTIVESRGHAKAVVHKGLLASAVAIEHSAHLAYRLVRFVNE